MHMRSQAEPRPDHFKGQTEPALNDVLDDPVVRSVMHRDGLDRARVESFIAPYRPAPAEKIRS